MLGDIDDLFAGWDKHVDLVRLYNFNKLLNVGERVKAGAWNKEAFLDSVRPGADVKLGCFRDVHTVARSVQLSTQIEGDGRAGTRKEEV